MVSDVHPYRNPFPLSWNTVQQIERTIWALTPSELEEFYAWLDKHCPPPIDAQLKAVPTATSLPDSAAANFPLTSSNELRQIKG